MPAIRATLHMLLLVVVVALLLHGGNGLSIDPEMNRRSAFAAVAAAGGATTGWFTRSVPEAHAETAASTTTTATTNPLPGGSLSAYQIFPDATPTRNPTIESLAVSKKYERRDFRVNDNA